MYSTARAQYHIIPSGPRSHHGWSGSGSARTTPTPAIACRRGKVCKTHTPKHVYLSCRVCTARAQYHIMTTGPRSHCGWSGFGSAQMTPTPAKACRRGKVYRTYTPKHVYLSCTASAQYNLMPSGPQSHRGWSGIGSARTTLTPVKACRRGVGQRCATQN